MRSVMAVSKPWPEKLCGTPNIPNRKTSRVATISANFQRRVLFMTKQSPNLSDRYSFRSLLLLLGLNFLIRGGQLRHGGLGHFQPQVVRRNPQMNGVILQSDHGAAQAASGGYSVAGLDALEHGLPFLLTTLLRHDHEKVKYADHQPHRDQEGEATSTR